jgi:hypothetical protein
MASLVFDSFWDDLARGNINLSSDTFYAMLVTSSYAENKKTHMKRSDVTNEVPATGGYSAGGSAVAMTVTKDASTDQQNASFANQVYASATITARKQVVYKHRGGASSADELVCINDFGADVIASGGTFTVNGSTIRLQN